MPNPTSICPPPAARCGCICSSPTDVHTATLGLGKCDDTLKLLANNIQTPLLDVHLPTTDGREIVLTRYSQPEKDLQVLLHQLQLTLPEQAPVPTSN